MQLNAAAHSAIALNAVRPFAQTMGGDLRPMTGRFLTGPLTLAASAVAGIASRVGQVAGLFDDPLERRRGVFQHVNDPSEDDVSVIPTNANWNFARGDRGGGVFQHVNDPSEDDVSVIPTNANWNFARGGRGTARPSGRMKPGAGSVGFDFNSVPGLGGGGLGSGPPIDHSNVPTTPRLNAALAMLQSANVMVANAQAAADAANQKVATEQDPAAFADDIAAQMQAITDLTNAKGVLAAAVQEAQAAQAEANAMAAANKKPAPGPVTPPAPAPSPPLVAPTPVAAKSSHLWEWLLGGAVVAAGGYYIAEQM